MKKRIQRLGALAVVTLMAAGLTMGCAESSGTKVTTEAATTAESSAAESAEVTTEAAKETKTAEETKAQSLPKVGIAWVADFEEGDMDEDVQMYINAVQKAGGEPVLLPRVENEEQAKQALASVGAVIMTGGEDIDPSYYKAEPDEKLEEPNDARDTSDYYMITEALKEDVPMLATCRGFQMLNAVCGGSLYQDIPTQYETELVHRDPAKENFTYHDILVEDGNLLSDVVGAGTLNVNSWHHQCVKELGEGLKVVAKADDGIIEGAVKEGSTYVMAVQFHPEWHVEDGDEKFLKFFTTLVEYAAK